VKGEESGSRDRGPRQGVTRRGVLAGAAMLGIGAGLDRVLASSGGSVAGAGKAGAAVPFYGARQAGISTAAQQFLNFAAFDVTTDRVENLGYLLQGWTRAAADLAAGHPYVSTSADPGQAPPDPGEAVGLGPAQLTITIGFGPGLFGTRRRNRFGLARRRPPALRRLPPFRGEKLDPGRSGGDLCVQACANDPQVAFHAIHVLAMIAGPTATLRWSQQGFGRTSSTSRTQATPRNLIGFKDGTDNIRAEDGPAMERFVWAQPGDGPRWMAGGSYLVARRIKFLFDVWDNTSLEGQQRVIGRDKLSGAPLGARHEYDPVDLAATSNGKPTIPADAHIRLASPQYNAGQRILRRGYSFSEPTEPGSSEIDAGLFFVCFQRDPRRQFVPIQRRLAASDALNRHTLHTASAIFACPPGAKPGGFVGEQLLS
jgi:deferrochelatase/peroxidase EfeB